MNYNIYCLKENGKIFYVGSTSRELEMRFRGHLYRKDLNRDEHSIHLLETCSSREDAKTREEYYIKKYDTVNNGANITYGYGTQGLGPNKTSFKKGNKLGELGTKRVLCVETGMEYPSITKCAEDMDLSISKISAVCRGKRKTHGGYRFRFI